MCTLGNSISGDAQVLPAYLNALSGKGVHVVTVNDYLAKRDSEWVGQIHRFLGLNVGLVQQGLDVSRLVLLPETSVTVQLYYQQRWLAGYALLQQHILIMLPALLQVLCGVLKCTLMCDHRTTSVARRTTAM